MDARACPTQISHVHGSWCMTVQGEQHQKGTMSCPAAIPPLAGLGSGGDQRAVLVQSTGALGVCAAQQGTGGAPSVMYLMTVCGEVQSSKRME